MRRETKSRRRGDGCLFCGCAFSGVEGGRHSKNNKEGGCFFCCSFARSAAGAGNTKQKQNTGGLFDAAGLPGCSLTCNLPGTHPARGGRRKHKPQQKLQQERTCKNKAKNGVETHIMPLWMKLMTIYTSTRPLRLPGARQRCSDQEQSVRRFRGRKSALVANFLVEPISKTPW